MPIGQITTIDKTVGTKISRTDVLPVLEETKVSNADGEARLTPVTQKIPMNQPPWIVNSGRYRSNMDVIAVGVHAHF